MPAPSSSNQSPAITLQPTSDPQAQLEAIGGLNGNGKLEPAVIENGVDITVEVVEAVADSPLLVDPVPRTTAESQADVEADLMLAKLDAMAAKLEAIAAARSENGAEEPALEKPVPSPPAKKPGEIAEKPETNSDKAETDRDRMKKLPAKLEALAAKLEALPAKLDAGARIINAKAKQALEDAADAERAGEEKSSQSKRDETETGNQPGVKEKKRTGQTADWSQSETTTATTNSAATGAASASTKALLPAPFVTPPAPSVPIQTAPSVAAKPTATTPLAAAKPPATTPSTAAKPPATTRSTVAKPATAPDTAAKPPAIPSDTSAQTATAPSAASTQRASALAYNPDFADRAVKAQNILTDKRFLRVAKTLMRFSLECCADKMRTPKGETEVETRKRSAARLRQALVDLGPTFIKLGQFLSVRRDCLSAEMADELALLQDKVPPFPFDLVRKTIVSELGAAPEKIFQSFDEKPIASASIGQVHRAVLPDGRPVVVKVQRPDLARRFYQDLGCMRLLAKWGLLIKPEGQWQSWIELYDEFGRNLFQEINYLQEGRNADRVRIMLKDQPEMQIPRVYWKYTGRRVLTLEYLPGIKIDNVKELLAQGYDPGKIGNQLVASYLEMVLMHGFFHADPHAGNLCIGPDGRIIIYDFGMTGEITDAQREDITGCIAAVITRDTEDLVNHLVNLGIVKSDAQLAPIVRTVQPFIDYYAGKQVKDLDFTDLEHDIDQIAFDRALLLPPTLAYLLRAGTSLEGIARTLKPNFSFVEAAKPALKRWMLSRPQQASSLVKVFINGNLAIGRDVFLKLANGKSSETQTKATKNEKPGKLAQAKPTAAPATPPAADQEELIELRSRIFMLENQLEIQSKQRYVLGAMALWLVFSTTAGFLPQCVQYANYFLIGNGVMGAIIMWHLVTHLRPDKSPTKKGSSRGQRR